MRKFVLGALALSLAATAVAKGEGDWIKFGDRPDADKALDEGRKPVQTLIFLGVKKRDVALDFMAGGGYYSEILSRAVEKKGSVVAWNPEQFVSADFARTKWGAIAKRSPNVKHVIQAFDRFDAPANSYNFALFHLTYHDLYWQSVQYNIPRTEPDAVLRRLYVAMKPGGIVGVVDHVGGRGDPRVTVDKFHRIDPEVVKADFARAGFQFAGESNHLRNGTDNIAKSVFDPTVRNRTDRFVYKFIKPLRPAPTPRR